MIENILKDMKKSSTITATLSEDLKNRALKEIALTLDKNRAIIIEANNKDIKNGEDSNLAGPILKRLKFDNEKIETVLSGIYGLIKLPDPVNKKLSTLLLDDGLVLNKVTVPIGVIGVIFESRPDALVQIACLCIKSGNCAILKGGSEASHTNRVLADLIIETLEKVDAAFRNTVYLIESREAVAQILTFNKYINLIIPRGSNEFVQYIQKNSTIPVLGHADGICHVYIDSFADLDTAVKVTVDSKTQYVSVCNAAETLLVHNDIAKKALPVIVSALKAKGVLVKGCERSRQIVDGLDAASEEDWGTEYLDYIISVKIVDTIEEAVNHINLYGSSHTDCIITENEDSKNYFKAFVDTASVMINCSTRFADGFRYGMGAEVGVSTNKIHARGPVGLEGLIIYKYILEGHSHIVADYTGENAKQFKHTKLD